MHIKIQKRIIAINMYIEDPEERLRIKERIYKYLEEHDPNTLYRLIMAR